jgi:Predicted membrane protein
MSVFKTTFNIFIKQRTAILMSVAITFLVTILNIQYSDSNITIDAKSINIAIVQNDTSEVAQNLVEYLHNTTTIVEIDDDIRTQQEALFYQSVDYILIIPANFSQNINANKLEKMAIEDAPATYVVDTLVNNFLTKYAFYQENFPNKTASEHATMVYEALKSDVEVEMLKDSNVEKQKAATAFNYLVYGFFSLIMTCVGFANVSFNGQDIANRNAVSAMSKRKITGYFGLAVMIFSIIGFVFFAGYCVFVTKSSITDISTILHLINGLIFSLTCVFIALLISNFVKEVQIISPISNVVVLAPCFICGVFVPQEMLGETVLKIATFFPPYWFVKNNDLIAAVSDYTDKFYTDFGFNLLIQGLFIILFIFLIILSQKNYGGLETKMFRNDKK